MLAITLFLALSFLPILKIGSLSIPIILLFFPVLFNKKTVIDKKYLKIAALSTAALACIHVPVLVLNGNFTEKGVAFVFYPLLIFFVYSIIANIIRRTEKNRIILLLKAFLVIQLLMCLIQLTNIFNIRTILEPLFLEWQYVNALKPTGILEIAYRPFGTIGSPVYLAIIAFIFGKSLQLITKKQIYYFIAILIILLSGARLAILMVALFFIAQLIIKPMLKHPIKSLLAIAAFAIITSIAINNIPFLQMIFEKYIIEGNALSSDYSVSYRMSMLDLMGSNSNTFVFGGYGIENFPTYVDSELILRIMQLGVICFIVIINMYYPLYKSAVKRTENTVIPRQKAIFLLACTLTSVVFTNTLILQYIIAGAAIDENALEKKV